MFELRFIEKVIEEGERKGTVVRILQYRDAPYAPWRQVPVVTLEEQQALEEQSRRDAEGLGSYG